MSPSSRPGANVLEFYKAPSKGAFSIPPLADWNWYEGQPGCALSAIGENVDRVVRAIVRKDPKRARLRNEALLTTRRNAFGPTLMDSEAIFKAAGRLMEAADHEIDLVSFAMEPDAQPYLELVRGFERRLATGRPLAQPFRIRVYADHFSVLFAGGLARPKARSLLAPWLKVFRAYQLDPRAVQIEFYVNAHGLFFYHHGGRYSVHDKLLVVDGSYLHIGGANPQAKNNYAHPERDTAVVVKGEVASSALAAFDALWSLSDFSCTIEKHGSDYRERCADRRVPFGVEHSDAVTAPRLDGIGLSPEACLPMILLSKRQAGFQNVAGYSNAWAKGFLAAVAASERHIALSSPNMNAPPLQGALVDAMTERDVQLSLLLPYERNEPQVNSFGGYGSNALSLQVMKACAIVARTRSEQAFQRFTRNFRAGWWIAEGERERFTGDGPGCFHTKFASFDDRAVIVGSGNLDDQSFFHSSETSVLIDSDVVTRAVSGFIFEPEWRRAERFDILETLFVTPSADRDPGFSRLTSDAFSICSGLSYSLK